MLTRIFQAAIILLLGTAPLAAETNYPSRTITIVVGFNAGGSTDLISTITLSSTMKSGQFLADKTPSSEFISQDGFVNRLQQSRPKRGVDSECSIDDLSRDGILVHLSAFA